MSFQVATNAAHNAPQRSTAHKDKATLVDFFPDFMTPQMDQVVRQNV